MSDNSRPWFLAKEKKERSDFWKSRSSGYSASNYWLRDSVFQKRESLFDKEESLEKNSRYDHLQLAQYQRAIANFVRILSNRTDIVVKYNQDGENKTDGKTVYLSPNIKENEFDSAVGVALHEASHLIYTDFPKLKVMLDELVRTNTNTTEIGVKKIFLNLIEDFYIDAMTYREAPGYRGYYSSFYQKYFGSDNIVKGFYAQEYSTPTWDNYMFHLINIRNPQRNFNALPGLKEMFSLIDLPTITRLKTFNDRIALANSLFELVKKYAEAFEEYQKRQEEKQQQASGASGSASQMTTEELNDLLEQMAENEEDGDDSNEEPKFVASNGIEIEQEMEDIKPIDYSALSETAKKQLAKMIEQQKSLILGDLKKSSLSKGDVNKVDAFASVDMEKVIVGANTKFTKKGLPLYIIRSLTNKFMDSLGSNFGTTHADGWTFKENAKSVEAGINQGRILAKKLQLRNEERTLKTSRLDSGKIDKRLLNEIGFGNYDIFEKVNIMSHKPSFIHISIDQSGSMGYSLFKPAMQFAAMFATASKYIPNIHLVISLRSTCRLSAGAASNENTPYLMYIFDSKKHGIPHIRNVFPRFTASSLTPEGLCFDGIMKETLNMAKNTEAYFINICDGEPQMDYGTREGSMRYQGHQAREHSRQQMRRMEAGGIKFITYFIGSIYSFDTVKECYGSNAHHLNSPSELGIITKTMNKKLLEV